MDIKQNWINIVADFLVFLRLEKSLSSATIEAYQDDLDKFQYFILTRNPIDYKDVKLSHIEDFLGYIYDLGLSQHSQARILSGVKSFFNYLMTEELILDLPTELIMSPNPMRKLPDVLSLSEIELILDSIDLSSKEGHRNKAIIETLYGCGLRVSELLGLGLSNYYPQHGYIRVLGKGHKERLVPIGKMAIKAIDLWLPIRLQLKIHKDCEDLIFLNRRGKVLTREMVFMMIQKQVATTSIAKNVSPHTFRHSFATHLVEGGADLRAVQEMLGHESITTTEIYTHLDQTYLRQLLVDFHPRS